MTAISPSRLFASALLILAVVALGISIQLGVGSVTSPAAGSWPALVSGGLLICAAAGIRSGAAPPAMGEVEPGRRRRQGLGVGLLVAYCALLPILGFLISTPLFLAAWIGMLSSMPRSRRALAVVLVFVVVALPPLVAFGGSLPVWPELGW